jgi:hypothetical protein
MQAMIQDIHPVQSLFPDRPDWPFAKGRMGIPYALWSFQWVAFSI